MDDSEKKFIDLLGQSDEFHAIRLLLSFRKHHHCDEFEPGFFGGVHEVFDNSFGLDGIFQYIESEKSTI